MDNGHLSTYVAQVHSLSHTKNLLKFVADNYHVFSTVTHQ